jgi:Uncharacterised ACR, YagE family COG1723
MTSNLPPPKTLPPALISPSLSNPMCPPPPASNVLDVPNLIWESEPTLHPLYSAVREYLEIKPRIQVLNERCRVFLDLAEILSEYISDNKMDRLTWIIIVLILLSILVTCSEVFLRFGILTSRSRSGQPGLEVGVELCGQFCSGVGVLAS